MMNPSRRGFLACGLGLSTAFAWQQAARAQSTRLEESDPAAQKVGYVHDAARVDKARFTTYQSGQNCAGCSLYQGDTGSAWGGCVLFGDRQVAAAGWCSAYATM